MRTFGSHVMYGTIIGINPLVIILFTPLVSLLCRKVNHASSLPFPYLLLSFCCFRDGLFLQVDSFTMIRYGIILTSCAPFILVSELLTRFFRFEFFL